MQRGGLNPPKIKTAMSCGTIVVRPPSAGDSAALDGEERDEEKREHAME
jgi:hypothetical protein